MNAHPEYRDNPADTPALRLVTSTPKSDTETPVTPSDHVSEVIRTPSLAKTDDNMTAADPAPLHEQPLTRLTLWSALITIVGELVIAAAIIAGGDPFYGIISCATLLICGLILMCSEIIPRAMANQDAKHAQEAKAMAAAR